MEEEIKQEFKKQEKRFDDLMEFLVENMATKDDIKNMATKDDITRLEAKLDAKIDTTESNLMQEIRTIDLSIKEIKDDINKLEKRIGEDIDAYAEDILDLRKRVKVLEQNQLEMA